MNKNSVSRLSVWGALFALQAGLSVAMGAFGAHGLAHKVSSQALGWWQTSSDYLMYHSLAGLLVIALISQIHHSIAILRCFFLGNFLFAGSLYVMTLTDLTWLGMITPLGGLAYLIGWGVFVWCFIRSRSN
ncbi:DUF423 domain-containing protein [Marinomonas sp.]